jgi:hypothetical protein
LKKFRSFLQHLRGTSCLTAYNTKNMNQDVLMPISILGSFGASIYFFTKVLTDYILKKKMIEKGYVTEETQSIFKSYTTENKFGALKWGLLFLSGGIALIIIDILNVRPNSPMPYGIFTVGLSLGFLVYYFIMTKKS